MLLTWDVVHLHAVSETRIGVQAGNSSSVVCTDDRNNERTCDARLGHIR